MSPTGRPGYLSQIDQLIAKHEEILRSLRLTKSLMNGQAREKKQDTNRELVKALTKEARRSHHKAPRKRRIADQRARSAAFLAEFDPKVPSRPTSARKGLGVMIRRGYLAKKGDGYIRTAKPYLVNPKRAEEE